MTKSDGKKNPTNHIKDTSKKQYAIGLTKRQLIALVTSVIIGLLIIVTIVLPVMNGSLHFLTVLSGSMTPAISPGDIVVSQYVDPETIKVDDIITFQHPDQKDTESVTHRVINISNQDGQSAFYTKGDANENPDLNQVDAENVIGKVVFVIPLLGYLVNFAQSLFGFILLIIIPSLILIAGEIKNLVSISKEESEK